MKPDYIGRFAPSPSGALHIGSLLTAVASFLDARAHGGQWLVRMEDLDPPREVAGAADDILRTLAAFGLHWDGHVLYQSQRHEAYQAALADLQAAGRVYRCDCSRKQVQAMSPGFGVDAWVYGGHCRGLPDGRLPESASAAWRLRVDDVAVGFTDAVVGDYRQSLAQAVGDFVLRRADGWWAYQLAVVVDDAEQGVTHIVRGQDLLVSTPRQMYLQQLLACPTPQYAHLPLLTNAAGQKWSKQTLAPALDDRHRPALLRQVFACLRLPQPPTEPLTVDELLAWGVRHWCLARVPKAAMVIEAQQT